MRTILLKFAGPLQSWGTKSHFETRHTDYYPSKSAVIGLVAASFGIKRDDDLQIQEFNKLSYAVRIDRQGQLLRDYHTARKYKSNGDFERTYVTQRYYLEDSIFVVAIGHQDAKWMAQIEEALKNPYFQPYMGRRSLPLVADFFLGMVNQGVLEALEELPWQDTRNDKDQANTLTVYADAELVPHGRKNMRRDRVVSFSQKGRQFTYRPEVVVQVIKKITTPTTTHDAFKAIGG